MSLADQIRKTRSELDLALDFFARHDSDPPRSDVAQYQFNRLHHARDVLTQEIHRAVYIEAEAGEEGPVEDTIDHHYYGENG